jgi:uncharacterized membrane protein
MTINKILAVLILVYAMNTENGYATNEMPIVLSGYSVKGLSLVMTDMMRRKEDPDNFKFFVHEREDMIIISVVLYNPSTRLCGKGGLVYSISAQGDKLLKMERQR